jgi:hypothetical protein
MKKVMLFVLICLFSLVCTAQAHAEGRYYGWGHRSVGVVPIVAAATLVTAAVIIASRPQPVPQTVMVVQPYYASPVYVQPNQPVAIVTH